MTPFWCALLLPNLTIKTFCSRLLDLSSFILLDLLSKIALNISIDWSLAVQEQFTASAYKSIKSDIFLSEKTLALDLFLLGINSILGTQI